MKIELVRFDMNDDHVDQPLWLGLEELLGLNNVFERGIK